jgi:hypothetical protein
MLVKKWSEISGDQAVWDMAEFLSFVDTGGVDQC